MTNNIDFVSAIHCGHSEAKLTRSNSDAPFKSIRRVRFPEDDKLISDYLEPFRLILVLFVKLLFSSRLKVKANVNATLFPSNAHIVFDTEMVKNGIDLSICNERYSRLSLRGIRLNRFHIESMEAIFQRAHFRVIDLENTFLDEQSASSLFDMLLHYESCTDLSISLNLNKTLPSQAWSRCVNFMRKSSALRRFTLSHTPLRLENFHGLSFYGLCLERLHFIDCNLTGQALYGLMQWLYILLSSTSLYPPTRDRPCNSSRGHKFRGWRHRRHSYTTSALNLSNTSTTNTINTNTTTINDTKPSIWELKLGLINNKLTSSDVEAILPLIRHQLFIPRISGPETVKFEGHNNNNNEISSSDALVNNSSHTKCTQLKKSNSLSLSSCDFLPVGGIGYLLELDLSHNNIGDDGLGILCTGLLQSYRNRLRERFSTLNDQEILKLTTMSSSPSTEKSSDSNSNRCCTQSIPMKICSLERLYLVDNNLSIDGMQSLAIVLMQTPKSLISFVGGLISLDLSNNVNIGDKGVEILCEGLIRNYSLKELYLRSINMSFSGIFALSSFLSESKCLKYLDIRNNNLDIASIMALSKTLFINKTLTSLVSDAHRWANSQLDLSDVDLIKSLIESIDSNLRRNRLETELVDNNNNNVSNINCDTITPTDVNDENSLGQSELMNNSSVIQCNDNSLTNCNIMNGEMSLDTTNCTSDISVIRSYECDNNNINNECGPDNNSNADLQSDNSLNTTIEQLDSDSNVDVLGNLNCAIISTNPINEIFTECILDNQTINKDGKFINNNNNNNNENFAIMEKRSKEEKKTTIVVEQRRPPLLQHSSDSFMTIENLSSSSNLFQNVNIPCFKDDKSLNCNTESDPIQSSVNVFDESDSLNTISQNNHNHTNDDVISK
ncbi:protein phosphatase 1 regulatory subunit 37 [Schistosoma bovis]|uniref:Protein phosphatase 1 regulatory subunit 37 n=1 Tax=Schistosoma bovis TaxID=6184 RepID=A0A430QP82_SCHBO|nr:protein phosphatase 1 regulatory subunit 37 [Schistosoma bovis]